MSKRQLATDITDFGSGALGLVELAGSYLNDRKQKRWSKPELIVYINEAQDEIAEIINTKYREFFLASATTPTVSGQNLYSMPTDLIELVKLEVVDDTSSDQEPQDLVEIMLEDKKFYELLDDANEKSKYGYFFIQGTNFRSVPEVASSNEFFRIFYVQRLVPMVNNADISKIPGEHHELIAVKACKRALVKDRRANPELNDLHRMLVANLHDSVQRYSRTREERRRPWRGSYGPYRSLAGYRIWN